MSITRHTGRMKQLLHQIGLVTILLLALTIGVGCIAFPLVFTEAVISNLIRLIEIIGRVT